MRKPAKLSKGDHVAIVSLSSGILGENFCSHQVALGVARLKEFGLRAVFMPNALKGSAYLADHPEARAQDLKDAFFNDEIKAIICAIGGDDTFRLLPYLIEDHDFVKQVKENPKIFLGFSDTTNNHFFFYKLGIVSYYGLNFLSDLAELGEAMLPYTRRAFQSLFVNSAKSVVESSPVWYEERTDFSKGALFVARQAHAEKRGYEILRGQGTVSGRLLGGCLESMSDMLSGSRYPQQKQMVRDYGIFPEADQWQDMILFIETSEEKPTPALFETLLKELDECGVFAVISGLIVGKPQDETYYDEYKKVLVEVTRHAQTPIIYNVNFGHSIPRTIIPYGLDATIDLDAKRIIINEPLFEK